MPSLRLDEFTRPAVVVAHPDDEALWFGGLLTSWPGTPPDVICCSIPVTEPQRAIKFQEACNLIGAKYKILPWFEVRGGHLQNLDWLDLIPYDVIFTHNSEGEYGHQHHKDVHEMVKKKCQGHIFTSAYGTNGEYKALFNWEAKLAMIKCYNHRSTLLGCSKHKELLGRWGTKFNLEVEEYNCEN